MEPPAPIAIIGIGCRFSGGADSPEKLWKVLSEGESTWSPIPAKRWNAAAFFDANPEKQGMHNTRGGHFVEYDIAAFDAGFWGIPPAECEAMDPQHRLQLEMVYEALENAGITRQEVEGSNTAVYIATFSEDYKAIQQKDINDIPRYNTIGTGTSIAANRISYQLDLRGPSVTLDTGCSGSMVAIHQACQSLRLGECGMALAGGVNLILNPDQTITMSLMRCFTEEGRCYSFDERGSGYGRGEGAAVVALKRLDDAIRDGDPIRAVIRNTGVNQDGRTNGMMLPNGDAQRDLIKSVYAEARLDPNDTPVVEAHGTGTAVGDPLEVGAIQQALRKPGGTGPPLLIGSVKPNVGHLESASGIVGLIKGVLMLEHRKVPATINIESLKPSLHLDDFNMAIPRQLQDWPSNTVQRLSLSNYGYGGTNAHLILESASEVIPSKSNVFNGLSSGMTNGKKSLSDGLKVISNGINGLSNGIKNLSNGVNGLSNGINNETVSELPESPLIVTLSAESANSIKKIAKDTRNWALNQSPSEDLLRNLAFTLASRRSAMRHRIAFPARTLQDVISGLEAVSSKEKPSLSPRLLFVFTGQGAQWHAMGRELMNIESPFRKSMQKSDSLLRIIGADWSLMEELSKNDSESRINESELAQSATCAIQMALVDLLEELGIRPHTVVGHSSGEIAAAYATRAVDQASALTIAWNRGMCTRGDQARKGAMLAVALGEDQAAPYLSQVKNGKAVIACANSPSSTTISGDSDAIAEIEVALKLDGIFARKLMVDRAYHSHHMQDSADNYMSRIKHLKLQAPAPEVIFVSSVTGESRSTVFTPQYWVDNLVSKVRFGDAISQALQIGASEESKSSSQVIIEIGPHNALAGPVRQILKSISTEDKSQLYSALARGKDSTETFASLASDLFIQGCQVKLDVFNTIIRPSQHPKVLSSLPPYAWNHSTKYWHESRSSKEHRFRKHAPHDLLGVQIPGVSSSRPSWRHILDVKRIPWLQEHVVNGEMIFPAAGYVSMVLEALRQISTGSEKTKKVLQYELRDVKFITPLVVPESGSVEIQLQLILVEGSQWDDFVVYGTEESDTVIEYCRGSAMATLQPEIDEVEGTRELSQAEETHSQYLKDVQGMSLNPVDTKSFYQAAREKGNSYGPHFACMKSMSLKGTQALSTFEVPDIAECMPGGTMQSHLVHPAVLDSFLHPPIALANIDNTSGSVVTASIGHLVVSPDLQSTAGSLLDSCTKLTDQWGQVCTADLDIFQSGAAGKAQPVVHIHDLRLQDIGFTGPSEESTKRDIVYIQKCGLDADYATAEDVDPFKSDMDTATESQASKVSALNSIAAYFINRTVEILDDDDSIKVATHYQRLVDWLRRFRKTQEFREIVNGRPLDSDVEDVVKDTQSLGVEGEVLAIIGQKLISVITGEIEPLSLFTEKGLLWRLYADDASARGYDISIEYLRHLVFKDPNMTVLEIGAGTGGATEPILQALAADSFPFESYDFTDISASFFEKSRERLKKWEKNMRYRKLNLQEDLVSQGYQEGSYDLIMASNVLHVAHDISQALTRIRKLLRPGGRILMIETTVTVPWLQFSIGVLPGWWGAEDGRINGPLLSEDEWDEKLKQNGLEGISVVGKDFEGPAHRCSMIVSKPLPMNDLQESQHLPIEIVLPPCWVDAQPALVQSLIDSMKKDGRNVTTTPLEGIESSSEKLYLVLDSGDAPVLAERDASLFQSITGLLTSPATLLWLSVQEKSSNVGNGKKNLITGVLRSARTENRSLRAYTLNVQDEIYEPQSVAGLVQVVSGLVQKMRLPDQTQPNMEFDSIYRGGQVFIERVLPDKQLDHSFAKSLGTAAVERQKFHQEGRPLKLSVKKTRIIDKMKFEVDLSIQGPLSPGIVEVRVEAFGINFKDVLIAGGHPKKKLSMAGEFAGVVVGVGADCQGYDIGDRVCGFGATPYASRIRVLGESIAKLPSDLTTCAGATIPVVFATAYHSLVDVARLEKGQTVLIHSAAGGVGQAAIAIAHWIGAEVFATVSNATKKDFLKQQFGLADDHIFSSKLRTFKDGINRLTGGKGVDVVLNSLSGQLLQDSLACVSRFGTFVEIGKTDIHAGSRLSLTPFDTNITLASVDLSLIQEHRPTKSGQLIRKVVSLIAEGQLKLPSFQTRPLEEISAAFISLQNRTHMGKIVLEAGEDAIAEAPPMQANFPLSSDATYVIAGGRGGLGRELAKRLANNGAKHLVLLSRRAVTSEEEEEISKTFGPMQTNVRVLSCDISNKASVQDSLPKCLEDMPPVRGVIQSTMVDHYALLQKMTVEDFRIGTEAKVDGTENLLKVLSNHPMDFFMMMSSLIGGTSGTTGQANYGAANAYLAGLTTSPMHSQTRFVAICPGVVEDVGILAGDEDVLDLSRRQGFITMQSKEAFALFDYAMSQEATSRGVNLITSGFDYESFAFAKSGRQDVLDNPLFSHVPRNDSKREGNNSEKTAGNIHELLANASSKSEADILIAQAIAKKVQTLVANEDDIDTSSKLVNLGIDSLTLVELKNWFVQTFQVRLQTSDIYDAPSIVHLAAVVATRSPKLNFEESSETSNGSTDPSSNGVEHAQQPNGEDETSLPKQPLPELDASLELWLTAVSSVLSDSEYNEAKKLVEEFQVQGGKGRKLQARLAMLANDPKIANWQETTYDRQHYLIQRVPLVPQLNFAGTHYNTNVHSAAERAAVLAFASHKFCRQLEEGAIAPLIYKGQRLETNQYERLFNSVRQPRKGEDVLVRYPGNNYLVAFRRGRAFKIELGVSLAILKSQFQSIIDSPCEPESWVGVLTTDERDSWAANRETLSSISENNAQLLHTIEAAQFVIYLDEATPETGRDRGRQFILTGFNRWADKTLQFSICDNGESATIGEHSMIDGHGMRRLIVFVQEAINGHTTSEPLEEVAPLDSHVFETNPELEEKILEAQSGLKERTAPLDFIGLEIQDINFDLFRNCKISPISGAQVAIQLACRKYFGFSPLAHETVGLAHFLKGRVEIGHTLWPAVRQFCDAASDTNIPKEELRNLFFNAARTHTNNLMRSTQGHGLDRHLLSLEWAIKEDEEVPDFFTSEIYKESRPKLVVTDCLESGAMEAHSLPAHPSGIWIHYEFNDNKMQLSVWGVKGKVGGFEQCVQESAKLVRDILEM